MNSKTVILHLAAALVLVSKCPAAILLLVTTDSPKLISYGEWTSDSFETVSDYDEITVNNGSSPNELINEFYLYSADGNTVEGEASGSITIGDSSTFTFAIDALSYKQDVGQYGEGTLDTGTWTIEIVAEAGETNGTPVILNWSGSGSGTSSGSCSPNWGVTFDDGVVFELYGILGDFSHSDSGQITTYSIGDTFSFSLEAIANGSSDGSITYDPGTFFTVTATAVPEPGGYGIAIAIALGILIAARSRRLAIESRPTRDNVASMQFTGKISRLVAVMALFLAAAPLVSHAALVTYSSTLTTTIAIGDSPVALDDQFHLTLTIDDSVEDTNPDPNVFYFPNALVSFSLSPFAANAGTWDPSSLSAVDTDGDSLTYSVMDGTAQRSFSVTPTPHSGTVVIDSTGTFAYDPGAGIGLEGTTDTFTVHFADSGSTYELQGSPYTVVPEPSTFALGALALATIALRRIRRTRRTICSFQALPDAPSGGALPPEIWTSTIQWARFRAKGMG